MLGECVSQVFCIAFIDTLDSKIIDCEAEGDGVGLVAKQARGVFGLLASGFGELVRARLDVNGVDRCQAGPVGENPFSDFNAVGSLETGWVIILVCMIVAAGGCAARRRGEAGWFVGL